MKTTKLMVTMVAILALTTSNIHAQRPTTGAPATKKIAMTDAPQPTLASLEWVTDIGDESRYVAIYTKPLLLGHKNTAKDLIETLCKSEGYQATGMSYIMEDESKPVYCMTLRFKGRQKAATKVAKISWNSEISGDHYYRVAFVAKPTDADIKRLEKTLIKLKTDEAEGSGRVRYKADSEVDRDGKTVYITVKATALSQE